MEEPESDYRGDIPSSKNIILVPIDRSLLEYARKYGNGPPPELSPETQAILKEISRKFARKFAKYILK